MNASKLFFNEFGRLRSGWRFTAFFVSCVVASAFLLSFAVAILSALPVGFAPRSFQSYLLQFTVTFAVALFFGWFYGKHLEDAPFRALGLWITKNWFRDLTVGLLVGAASICLAALVAFAFGGKSFRFNDSTGSAAIALTLAASLAIFIAGAVFEEVFLRGYPLQTFARARLAAVGTILTSLIFATLHNSNPNATTLSWLNTFLAGVWFAAAYFKTRNLWFPIGLHLAWNWFQGSILGVNVSGLKELTAAPLFQSTDYGPAWLTGADYGLEGGIACTVALVASTAVIWYAPFLKPTEDLLALTSEEKPAANEREKDTKQA